MAFKIAALLQILLRGIPNARDIDDTMAKARQFSIEGTICSCAAPDRTGSYS